MRISDHRYTKDRQALEVAARMIDFEARTGTIHECTGLVDGRIRNLYRACGVDGRAGSGLRHRGSAPRSVAKILANTRQKEEAITLLGVCQLMGIAMDFNCDQARTSERVAHAEKLCEAFWTFRQLFPAAAIGFEHLLLLLSEIAKGENLATALCQTCSALVVLDPLSLEIPCCTRCIEPALQYESVYSSPFHCVAEESACA